MTRQEIHTICRDPKTGKPFLNRLGYQKAHRWRYKWKRQYRRCERCNEAEWYWFCMEMWRPTLPAVYFAVGHRIHPDAAPEGVGASYGAIMELKSHGNSEHLKKLGINAFTPIKNAFGGINEFNWSESAADRFREARSTFNVEYWKKIRERGKENADSTSS